MLTFPFLLYFDQLSLAVRVQQSWTLTKQGPQWKQPAWQDTAVHSWLSPSHLACTFCYWTIGHSPVHSSKHTMLPDGELQKTCRLSPSNSKILAADLKNRSTRDKDKCHICIKTCGAATTDTWNEFHKHTLYLHLFSMFSGLIHKKLLSKL